MGDTRTKDQKAADAVIVYEKTILAAKRRLRLAKAHDDLISFTELMMPDPSDPDDADLSRYKPSKHHQVIAAALQEVEKGNILRLIITMPPRAGKSELSSKKFIPWLMGRDPYKHVIFASYNETFAQDTGRAVRDLMKQNLYKQVFPGCDLRAGSAAADRVQTKEGGIAAFVGVGGSITGRGADCLLIDDPIKDREQADSPTERNKQWEWFTQVAMTRLMTAGSRVIIIMTRWHEDDLIGRLTDPTNPCYNKDEAKSWKMLALPAIAEDNDPLGRKRGESLWPDRFPVEFLENARRLNPRGFSALYQGRPTPDDGEFFKKDYLKTYKAEELPKNLRIYCASDHAVSTKQDRDPTVLLAAGVDEDCVIWVLPDLWWRREQTDKVVEAMIAMMRRHKPLFWWAENGHISKAIGPFLRKRMIEEQVFCSIVEQTPVKDKMTRAQSIQAMASLGRVRFPSFAPWWSQAEQEMLKFPAARHDDFVDALAWIGIGLNLQHNASPIIKPKNEIQTGTLAWVKHQARADALAKRLAYRDGF
jgi:predicted phage terminase large subunit-like protein